MARLLREAGAREPVTALLARDPATQVSLDDPYNVAGLLGELREAGAQEQLTALTERLPAGGGFDPFIRAEGRREFRFGREPDGSVASPWAWEDLD
ncbi:hypothetical protein GCM10010329_79630 [Streptomyces spiroverticillatus]|uniref:Uncharacterized protein n=1 Tax=Streptomyces finlayi TaxID=67296 RepID=A0A919CFC6_9ACTN|nr:hypothetical protein [Streptomyces finlayi]GHA44971.1 hypothetical protein GCM10010329_79630 [Streptomyces spiroverticillatus]GHD18135.1 hypothetical protein GCM10010334_80610 [Streptomyces finlayi]